MDLKELREVVSIALQKIMNYSLDESNKIADDLSMVFSDEINTFLELSTERQDRIIEVLVSLAEIGGK